MKSLAIAALFCARLSASPVAVTLEAVGSSDGAYAVLPYELNINGRTVAADCYDFFDPVHIGESWKASELTLGQAIASGQFSSNPNVRLDYEMVAILSTLPAGTTQEQIDLQHAIWDVFDPGSFAVTSGVAQYDAAATAQISTFDYSRVIFLEGCAGADVQAFVLVPTPEPGTLALISLALLLLALVRVSRPE